MPSSWIKGLTDEEMAKKYDDKVLPSKDGMLRRAGSWNPSRGPQRRSLKRVLVLLGIAFAVYLFIHNIPTDLGPTSSLRPVYTNSGPAERGQQKAPGTGGTSPGGSTSTPESGTAGAPERTYNDPPKFLELGVSLRSIGATQGGKPMNRNILFAASSLKSVATLLPVACEMGRRKRNYVHFALMSRSEIDINQLQRINGVDDTCEIIFHDARPEFASISTESRMKNSVFRAFHHLHTYVHPQAILIDGSSQEERFFLESAKSHKEATANTLIELPENFAPRLTWLTKLDSIGLHVWNTMHIDILIHVKSGASGSLIRLLNSLSNADYTSSSVPQLTMELPHDIDDATKRFLETYQWPPARYNPTNARHITLRHRIPRKTLTEEESSIKVLESFWPANTDLSHVLLLSPEVELSRHYFQYLKYTLMEYKYSAVSRIERWDRRLLAISLEQPLFQLNGASKLSPPLRRHPSGNEVTASFLWQAPTSNAVLYLGDKWVELHDFVTRSFEAQQKSDSTPALLSDKAISTRHPSWLEHALRLARVRGYMTLYPGEEAVGSLATVHSEQFQLPEEYAGAGQSSKDLLPDDATDAEIEKAMENYKPGAEIRLAPAQDLPGDGELVPLGNLPSLAWDGKSASLQEVDASMAKFAAEFRDKVGNCPKEEKGRVLLSTQDLFCVT